ncbi:BTB/POZ domain-containing protein 8 [Trichinella papuae]|uniref:BTB/POZ domain-containing protein 8 n=1 Tax=Trichinella papuae TaxID=268474 RepID=A0A0V1MY45_9BILA|nr:BTB/POZ domain-containing protein 8 [Trichinella papuae]
MLRSSPTSASRYHVEKLNLKSTVAKNLRDAMESLIGDLSSFADILLESNDGIRLAVHSCILKCRAPQFYTNHIAATFESKADNYCSSLPRVVAISEMDFNCMSKFVHKIYTDDTAIDDNVIDSRHSGATTFTIDSETYLLNSDPNGNQFDNNTVEDETELADSDLLLEESSTVECQSCTNEQEQIRSSVKDNIQATPKSDNRNSEHSLIDCTNEQQQQVISFKATDPCSALGTDLLCMFLTGQGVDCTIRSRSAQFNVHNNEAVSFMLMFIYGGVLEIPDSVDLIELYRLADITQLNALKTLVVLELRAKRCHYFHKPCSQCATFVLRHLSQFNEEEGLQELYEAALDWQAEYFADIWRSKSFSQLPEHVQNACYERILDQVNSESALQLLLDCDALLKRSRTLVAAVSTKVARISEHCLERIGNNFADILASDYFIHLGKGFAFDLPFFEDLLPTVIHSLQLEEACRVLAKLAELKTLVSSQMSSNDETWNERFLHFLKRLYELCDSRLIHHASQVVNCHNWALLSHDMQERIRETGIFVDFKQPNNAARQKVLASLQARRHRSTSRDVATNGRTDEATSCKPKFPLAKAVSHPRNNFQPSARLVPVGRKVNNLHKQQQQQQKKRFVKSCDALNTERTLLVVGDDELWLPLSESTENKPTTPKTKLAKQLPPANIPQNARIVKSPKSRSTIRH